MILRIEFVHQAWRLTGRQCGGRCDPFDVDAFDPFTAIDNDVVFGQTRRRPQKLQKQGQLAHGVAGQTAVVDFNIVEAIEGAA